LAARPVAVTETASTSAAADGAGLAAKRAWVAELYAWLPASGVRMVVWFDADKETDWAVFGGAGGDETVRSGRTTYRALGAYRTAVGSAAYVGSDPTDPRLLSDDRFAGR
jgi:mannan endo-1,4-beta-mannosidase